MEMRIAAREKLGYLTGDALQPSKLSSIYSTWCREDFRVKGWLIDSMSPDLMSRFIRLSTVKEIWDAVKKTYFDGGDETFLFDLNKWAFTIKQNGAPVHK
ncbi:PREDICTED: UBN2_3 domain-containing [Prunus dulcis]|uniref:PREDICTED: UBN2_3 domain-containing n=1 Tax=Prunus dulcis TaxID=3755 RepID=A0A5E4GCU3_PRUDU|nr:PREDICTED: UBN2_3 domain-containing [Prunus dulcis]